MTKISFITVNKLRIIKKTQLVNIFDSGWYIFLKSFGDIPGMFVH